MHTGQLRDLTRRVLTDIGLWSPSAENLLLGTFAQESGMGTYIRQLGGGPALGIGQMEPATHDDIWRRFLWHRMERPWFEAFEDKFIAGRDPYVMGEPPVADQLEWNLAYAICMTRIHYLRVPEPLPDADDVHGMARYWKEHYNTRAGKGTEREFVASWSRYLGLGIA